MGDGGFDAPRRITIKRLYTRGGDAGETALAGGGRVSKDDPRIEAFGAVDELNAFVGAARQRMVDGGDERFAPLSAALLRVQHQLFDLGSILATLSDEVDPRQARARAADIEWLEAEIDAATAALPPLRSFVLPGGSASSSDLHICRTVCRRAERLVCTLSRSGSLDSTVVAHLNRLSDAFFAWSRLVVALAGGDETLWSPGAAGD